MKANGSILFCFNFVAMLAELVVSGSVSFFAPRLLVKTFEIGVE